ncbi:immunity repressor [Gordonia phage DumpsterDude]|uniref:Immunity repressor n=1 Tax=Gordonia phage DumpsterDude TaxID=2713262 RepID=A0A6G8R0C3_9CAUD|nr:immunity repressor [Gordonia phage DumpsterDude]QIN93633.1 immunity repressor [Gordonia phage DumpsterDude]
MGDVKTPALWSLIQAHLDEYGVTDAEFARRMGVSPQTLNSWKKRGVRQLPARDKLEAVAELTRNTYAHVLDAALVDAGYRNELRPEVVEVAQRIRDLGAEYWDALDDLIEELRQDHYARLADQRPKLRDLIDDGTTPTTRAPREADPRQKTSGKVTALPRPDQDIEVDEPVAARRGRGKTKGEQLRDRDAGLGEESQDSGEDY